MLIVSSRSPSTVDYFPGAMVNKCGPESNVLAFDDQARSQHRLRMILVIKIEVDIEVNLACTVLGSAGNLRDAELSYYGKRLTITWRYAACCTLRGKGQHFSCRGGSRLRLLLFD